MTTLEQLTCDLVDEMTANNMKILKYVKNEEYEEAEILRRINHQAIKNTADMMYAHMGRDLRPHFEEQNDYIFQAIKISLFDTDLIDSITWEE